MDFSKKEILLIIGILVVVVVAGFFYWPGSENREEGIIDSQLEEKCLEKYSQMSENEFLEAIKEENLEFPFLEISEIEERMLDVRLTTIDYLVCKMGYDKSEDFYNKAREGTEGMNISEENKQSSLSALEKAYATSTNSYDILLALGALEEICPDKFRSLCLEIDIGNEKFVEFCKNICDRLNFYFKDRELFEKEVVQKKWDDNLFSRISQYRVRSALAYRLGGKDLVLKVCDYTENLEKENCVSYMNGQIKKYERCDVLRKEILDLICKLDIE